MWGFAAIAILLGNWVRPLAERKADSRKIVVEALGPDGGVLSDPRTYRYIVQVIAGALGLSFLVWAGVAYGHRQGSIIGNAATLLVILGCFAWVFWTRFGNISEVESDDGATLTLRQRGHTSQVPWEQIESVEVSRPYAFWQVTIKFRFPGESKIRVARFLPLGWRKMTPGAAEKLQATLMARKTAN